MTRWNPPPWMVDFIRWLTEGQSRVTDDLYLRATPNDGDNSDNGHWIVDLTNMTVRKG